MSNLNWYWAYVPYLDPPNRQRETASKAGYNKVCFKSEVDTAIEELNAKNSRLKRALWLARADRAKARKNYWYVRSIHEGDKEVWSIDGSAVKYIGCIKKSNFDWLKIWSEVECKCRAKAKKYK